MERLTTQQTMVCWVSMNFIVRTISIHLNTYSIHRNSITNEHYQTHLIDEMMEILTILMDLKVNEKKFNATTPAFLFFLVQFLKNMTFSNHQFIKEILNKWDKYEQSELLIFYSGVKQFFYIILLNNSWTNVYYCY